VHAIARQRFVNGHDFTVEWGVALQNASTVAPSPPLVRAPSCGLTGWTLAVEYLFGTAGNIKDIADLQHLFTSDAPWGRINGELQTFQPFNARNHVFESDHLALVAIPDGSGLYSQHAHITSGAVITKLTCSAPCIVEFVAKLPAGRGVWPSLWLYDCHSRHSDSSEIDIMESQFNAPPGQVMTAHGSSKMITDQAWETPSVILAISTSGADGNPMAQYRGATCRLAGRRTRCVGGPTE
jgi:hypothetical protein